MAHDVQGWLTHRSGPRCQLRSRPHAVPPGKFLLSLVSLESTQRPAHWRVKALSVVGLNGKSLSVGPRQGGGGGGFAWNLLGRAALPRIAFGRADDPQNALGRSGRPRASRAWFAVSVPRVHVSDLAQKGQSRVPVDWEAGKKFSAPPPTPSAVWVPEPAGSRLCSQLLRLGSGYEKLALESTKMG